MSAVLTRPLARATPMDVYLVGWRYGHHARHSGYEGFSRYIGKRFRSPFRFRFLKFKRFPLLGWQIDSAVCRFMDRECYSLGLLLNEMSAAVHAMVFRGSIYHFIYGDTDVCWLGRLRDLSGIRVVATFHEAQQGLEYLRIDKHITDHLDAVILVAESQRAYFETFMPRNRVFVVPHGIDTEFFRPAKVPQREQICLTVGGHLRDFDTLGKAIDIVHATKPQVRFIAVGVHHGHIGKRFEHPAVEFLSGISDEALRALYQRAAVAVCSLKEASANNSLLEAMACGTPVVATDTGGVKEYMGQGGLLSPPHDPETMAAQMNRILNDESLAADLGEAGRRAAIAVDYRVVAERQADAYARIAALPTRNR